MGQPLQIGDRVTIVNGHFRNVPNDRIIRISGSVAQVTFGLLGQMRGPVAIPASYIRRLDSDDSPNPSAAAT